MGLSNSKYNIGKKVDEATKFRDFISEKVQRSEIQVIITKWMLPVRISLVK